MSTKTQDTLITLNNVRLSFPALFTAKKGPEANSKPAFAATFILDKTTNAKDIAAIKAGIAKVVAETPAFKGKTPAKTCLRDGSEKSDTEGYGDGIMFVSARNEKRQMVVDGKKQPMDEQDTRLFAGCYVNAVVRLWAQDNQFGKRVNASLGPVQYVRPGAAFGGTSIDANAVFGEVSDDDSVV